MPGRTGPSPTEIRCQSSCANKAVASPNGGAMPFDRRGCKAVAMAGGRGRRWRLSVRGSTGSTGSTGLISLPVALTRIVDSVSPFRLDATAVASRHG
jgi:hypothetical protein